MSQIPKDLAAVVEGVASSVGKANAETPVLISALTARTLSLLIQKKLLTHPEIESAILQPLQEADTSDVTKGVVNAIRLSLAGKVDPSAVS